MIYLERSLLMVDQSSSPYVNSVLHAVRILELYAAQRRESLSLTGISRALSLHKTTVYRILRTLQHAGWIEQSEKAVNTDSERESSWSPPLFLFTIP